MCSAHAQALLLKAGTHWFIPLLPIGPRWTFLCICNRAFLISSWFYLLTWFGNTSIGLPCTWEAFLLLTETSLMRWMGCLPGWQASTPYTLESESLRMDCIMSGGSSPSLAINTVTNKVGHGRHYERWHRKHVTNDVLLQVRSCRRCVTPALAQVTRCKQEVFNLWV